MNDKKKCFVIMPISNCDGYDDGHFNEVYEELIQPACEKAGFEPIRADEVNTTHSIKMDILNKIASADMVVCDISAKNPNVLYELGIRHALNKPVSIIKDDKTDKIFDIDDIRWVGYAKSLRISVIRPKIAELAENIKNTYNSPDDSFMRFALKQNYGQSKVVSTSVDNKPFFPRLQNGHVAHWNKAKEVGLIKSGDEEFFFHTGCCVQDIVPAAGDTVYFYGRDLGGPNPTAVCIVTLGSRIKGKIVGVNIDKKYAFIKISDPHSNESSLYMPVLDDYDFVKKEQVVEFTIATNNTGACAQDTVAVMEQPA
ncbi:hypothetical protein PSECIP111951_03936 [Pseudoalteromonas holothuriae]|uniref:Uncharacterized protein n=1 Tax=Pseudoalteromonas holothuriae TaxID=2963714 RepID=A0ABN8UTQ7_9GAMM|nr:hypothetical protein [Pseudoalteromonas sp. CIP111951]CAH9067907.1 hypothetical protein PSECIP111951_03936 [Pseudoalteromonas sp. CIP111951]